MVFQYIHPKTKIEYIMVKVETCWYMERVNGNPIETEGFIASGAAYIETPENLLSMWFSDCDEQLEREMLRR